MNGKTKRSRKTETGPNPCVCQGAGPLLSEWLRRMGPPAAARQHFDAARVEFLKGLRALLDARIAQMSKTNSKGQKINVE